MNQHVTALLHALAERELAARLFPKETIQALLADDTYHFAESAFLVPLRLQVVKFGHAFHLLEPFHQGKVASQNVNVLLLLLVQVQRVLFLHG